MNLTESLHRLLMIYPVASALQLAVLLNTSLQVARRVIRIGVHRGQLRVQPGFNARGRPVLLVSLRLRSGRATAHDWEVTEFAVRLVRTLRNQSDITFVPLPIQSGEQNLRPDFSFVLTSRLLKKSLLFFLEVDRATEPIQRNAPGSDFASKLRRYRELRTTGNYRAAPTGRGIKASGFRVLVVTPSDARSMEILRAAQTHTGGDFVWVSAWSTLDAVGFHANAWLKAEGDRHLSIFGSLAPTLQPAAS